MAQTEKRDVLWGWSLESEAERGEEEAVAPSELREGFELHP